MSRSPRLDTAGMWEAACGLPEQVTRALESARAAFGLPGVRAGHPVRAVVACGLGTGGAACDAVAALTARQLAVPLVVCRDAVVPAIVGTDCLVVAVSCGESPETVAAARQSEALGARVVAVGNDAALARHAAGAGIPWCELGPRGPSARTALGAATVSLLYALSSEGLIDDCSNDVRAAAEDLARRRDAFVAENGPATALARRIGRTIPLVYGSNGLAGVAARWWKSCVNLNAKSPAFAAEVPGLAYDELAGWGQGGDVTRQTMTMVFLRHNGEPSAAAALFESVRDASEEVMADVLDVKAESGHDLGALFELALLGELVSLELAAHEGVDPGPVPVVDNAHARQP